MKKNILFILLAVFFTSSFSYSQVGKQKRDLDNREPNEVTIRYNEILNQYVSADGKVAYKLLMQDPLWSKLVTDHNAVIPVEKWSDDRTKAYWINSYNINTIDLILNNYPLKSINDIDKPWDTKFIQIGELAYSLNDIEHNILRKKFNDPKIHFGINCASYSCPNLLTRAYYPNNVEILLEKATVSFLEDSNKNEITPDKVTVSKIFDWFADDFKKGGKSVIGFINQYSTTKVNPGTKIEFMEYDWSLNSK